MRPSSARRRPGPRRPGSSSEQAAAAAPRPRRRRAGSRPRRARAIDEVDQRQQQAPTGSARARGRARRRARRARARRPRRRRRAAASSRHGALQVERRARAAPSAASSPASRSRPGRRGRAGARARASPRRTRRAPAPAGAPCGSPGGRRRRAAGSGSSGARSAPPTPGPRASTRSQHLRRTGRTAAAMVQAVLAVVWTRISQPLPRRAPVTSGVPSASEASVAPARSGPGSASTWRLTRDLVADRRGRRTGCRAGTAPAPAARTRTRRRRAPGRRRAAGRDEIVVAGGELRAGEAQQDAARLEPRLEPAAARSASRRPASAITSSESGCSSSSPTGPSRISANGRSARSMK